MVESARITQSKNAQVNELGTHLFACSAEHHLLTKYCIGIPSLVLALIFLLSIFHGISPFLIGHRQIHRFTPQIFLHFHLILLYS